MEGLRFTFFSAEVPIARPRWEYAGRAGYDGDRGGRCAGDTDKKPQPHAGYGTQDVALPAGAYFVEIAGGTEPITVTDGKVVEF
jgi:hypothetical protein